MGSVIMGHGLSCSEAGGILPDQGWNPCPLHWQVDSYPLYHQGSPLYTFVWDMLRFYPVMGQESRKRVGEEVLGVFLRMVLGKVMASDEAIRDGSLDSSGMERTILVSRGLSRLR